jgi:hypothetical protein
VCRYSAPRRVAGRSRRCDPFGCLASLRCGCALLTVAAALACAPQNMQKLPAVELDKVFALEQHAMAQAADLRRLIGKGVTEEAQDLFDVLHKTLPCAWDGQRIIVGVVGQNEVIVTPPYAPESASGNDPKSLEHVRKVVSRLAPSPRHSSPVLAVS